MGIETLSTVLAEGLATKMKEVNTVFPARVVAFSPQEQTVSVQPLLRTTIAGITQDLPILTDIPLIVLQGGKFHISLPIAIGDECLILTSQRGYDNWYASGEVSLPSHKGTHSLSDGFCLVGVGSAKNKIGTYNASEIEVSNGAGTKITLGNGDIVMRGAVSVYGSLTVQGDTDITGDTSIIGATSVTGEATIIGATSIVGNLAQTGGGTQTGELTVTGNANISGVATAGRHV